MPGDIQRDSYQHRATLKREPRHFLRESDVCEPEPPQRLLFGQTVLAQLSGITGSVERS